MEVTRYEYDQEGRLVGSVVEREAEFSRVDVESLIAYVESQRVGSHGYPMSEATSPDGNPSSADRKWDWVVGLPDRDFVHQALNSAKKAYREAYPDAEMDSLLWRVEKRPVAQ